MKQETQAVLNMNEKHLRGYMAGYLSKEAKISLPDINPELKKRLLNTALSAAAGGGAGALYDQAVGHGATWQSPLIGAGLGAAGYTAYDALKNYRGSGDDYDSYLDFLKGNRVSTSEKILRALKGAGKKVVDTTGKVIHGGQQAVGDVLAPLYLDEEGGYDPNGPSNKIKATAKQVGQATQDAVQNAAASIYLDENGNYDPRGGVHTLRNIVDTTVNGPGRAYREAKRIAAEKAKQSRQDAEQWAAIISDSANKAREGAVKDWGEILSPLFYNK